MNNEDLRIFTIFGLDKTIMIMKKVIVLMFSMVMVIMVSHAQELAIGLKGGLNFANVDTKSAGETYKNRTGYNFGAFALFKFSKIGLQPEILFSKQGSTVHVNTQDFKSDFSYVNVPILLKLYTIAGINIQVGPQFGFLTAASQQVLNTQNQTVTQNIKSDIKGSDISAAFGLGWDLLFGLSIDARYNLGLTKINSQASSDATKNQVFQVSVGYKIFKLGH
jgi:hypothetical protein